MSLLLYFVSKSRIWVLSQVIAQHIYKFNHEFDWDNTQILDFETNYNKRPISLSEMIHIKEQKNKSEKYIFIRAQALDMKIFLPWT